MVRGRGEVGNVLDGSDDRVLLIVGPCSVHDPEAALDYAGRLAELSRKLSRDLLIAMRVYFEKPRTTTGWKGLINDPHLDGSGDVNTGLRSARQLLLKVLDLGLPVGTEFLDPITPQYIADAISWGAIGARTTESQIHRQLGSGLSMPIGFKNRTDGNVQVAVDAVRAAAAPHAFPGIDDAGAPAILYTTGNADGHVILRGGKGAPNHDAEGIAEALMLLHDAGLPERVVVDASHDNSSKDPGLQYLAAGRSPTRSPTATATIVGVMLESFLVEGRQDLGDGELVYGQSITDPCLDWETTVSVLEPVRSRSGGSARRMRIAVLGVGLIGGSIGLAARRRLRVRGGRLRPRRRHRGPRRRGGGDRLAPPARSRRPARGPRSSSAPLPSPGSPSSPRRRWRPLRRTPSSPTSARPSATSSPRSVPMSVSSAATRWPGPRPSGVENARADLFEGARWYLTPKSERSSGVLYDRLQRTVTGLGARVQAIDAETHDRLMATVSHLPHVVANVLVGQAAAELTRDSERMPEVGPSFRDTTRVAGANPAIWGDIFASNREAVAEAVEAVAARLRDAAGLIREGDREAVAEWHAGAAADRRQLLESELAGGPLREIRVVVSNRPGTIAELALTLGEAGVNIEDMALYPTPDMTSGAVSLWVAGDEQAARAAELVRGLGHTVSVVGDGE